MDEHYIVEEFRTPAEDPYSSTPNMEIFVGKMRLLNGEGFPGLIKQLSLRNENSEELTPEKFARCIVALGLRESRPSGLLMANIASRFARGHQVLSTEFIDFALLTVLTIFDDGMFERLLNAGLNMTPLSASEVLDALTEIPMHLRVKSRSED